jgi:hypothetical protein
VNLFRARSYQNGRCAKGYGATVNVRLIAGVASRGLGPAPHCLPVTSRDIVRLCLDRCRETACVGLRVRGAVSVNPMTRLYEGKRAAHGFVLKGNGC